ncbi:MAG: VCBS repeat-containing protein [Nannocystis sp.]|nr:VCBS repeat-containing protein [Nannocystis sp.]
MRRLFVLSLPTLALLLPTLAQATPWVIAPQSTFNDPPPGRWSTKVELADINGDGWVDVLFANVGGYQAGTPDSILANQAFINQEGTLVDKSAEVFGWNPNDPESPSVDTGRVIKAYDFDSDGDLDILVGATWQSYSRYFVNEGNGQFTEMSENLPQVLASIGDVEVADVDGDGDLDVVATDWGPAPVGFLNSPGGRTMLWLNDGSGYFDDATETNMPGVAVNWSWELEFIDVDNDWDVDLAISCRSCSGGFLFRNDGGVFTNATPGNLPQKAGSVDFEVMDINGDSYVDIVSLQDGDGGGGEGFRNRVLINNQSGGFEDQSSTYWKPLENAPSYDYMLAFLDANSDRKPDMVVGAFANWKDRLLTFTNGTYVGDKGPFGNVITDGTYALAVGDLNNDTKIDLVLGEGENAFRNRVFLAADIGIDTGNPVIQNHVFEGEWTIGATMSVHARAHDNKSPNKDHDWNEVVVEYVVDEEDITNVAELEWYGEYLWRTEFVVPIAKKLRYRICAEDRAGNRECTPVTEVEIFDPNPMTDTDTDTDSSTDTDGTATMTASDSNTATDSDSNSATESDSNSNSNSNSASQTDSDSNSGTATVTASASASASATDSDSDSDSATTFNGSLDDDGCGCRADDQGGALPTALGLLGLLGLRRRRRG